jgi:hypothetical protein
MMGTEYSAMPLMLSSGTVLVLVVSSVLLGLQMVKRTGDQADADDAVQTAFDTVRDAIAREIRGMTMDRAHAHIRATRPWVRVHASAVLLDNGDIAMNRIGYPPAPWAIQLVPTREAQETSPRPQLLNTNAFLTALPNQPLKQGTKDTRRVVAFLLHQNYGMGPNGISKTTWL